MKSLTASAVVAVLTASIAAYLVGFDIGYAEAEARQGRVERQMKDVGVCVWAEDACSTWTEDDSVMWRERVHQGMTE